MVSTSETRTTPRPITFTREEFLRERWQYEAGEHVTFIGPTGSGKTFLAYQLLEVTTDQELPGVVLVIKPRDETVETWTERLGYKVVQNWPPPPRLPFTDPPNGWVVWPRHSFDPAIDNPAHHVVFRRAILDNYRKGHRIIFADELYGLVKELRLEPELVTLWSRGRSMGAGLWGATQKPSHVPLWAYNQAEHLFLWYEPDERGRIRFREIGGFDSRIVSDVVLTLTEFQCLYINREHRAMCIIEPE